MRRFAFPLGAFWLALSLLLMSLPVQAQAQAPAAVRAWLDRDSMQLGETVTLNVEATEASATPPDFSALQQDFTLLNTQSSRQINVVNGVSTAKTLWAVALEPRHAGEITVAPIAVAGAHTAPIRLNVAEASATAQPVAGGDVFLEVSAEPLTPYVQQQVRYTVKLYYAFELTEGNLAEPQADGLGVRKLGQDKPYTALVGARRYYVVERHYALTPERSGAIDIAALAFRGSALDGSDPTGFFSRGRRVSAQSQALHLEVKPKPASWADGAWLPAAGLQLKDDTPLPDEVHVGDPFTRSVRLQAQGLAFEQLPELSLDAPDGAEMYPDKTDTRTRDDGAWLLGERVRKFAFVPNRAGTLTVPGMRVRWWNTASDRAEVAELPARTIRVLPAAAGNAVAPTAAGEARAGGALPVQIGTPASAPGVAFAGVRLWKLLAGAGFALWLLTLLLWWRWPRSHRVAALAPTAPAARSDQRAAFLRACALGELAGAERALVAWARGERADVRNLGELATRLSDAAQRDALALLQRVRYAGATEAGLGTQLQQAFKGGLVWAATSNPNATASALPALYPQRERAKPD